MSVKCAAPAPDRPVTCRTCGIVTPESWDKVPAAILVALNSRKTIRRVEKGSVLFHEGDMVTTLFRLLHGVVLLRKGDHDGNSIITRMVTPRATFGFRAFAARDCHTVTAQCATDVTVCCIPADAAELAFASNRSLERAFAQHLAHELNYAEDVILAQMNLSVRERILLMLDQIAGQFGRAASEGAWAVEVPVLRSDIAAMAGIARETFSRCLAALEKDELLHFVGHSIHIPSIERFRAEVARVRDSMPGGVSSV